MNALRLWILGVAFGSFTAGVFVGQVWRAEPAIAAGLAREQAFAEELASRYGLSAEQHRKLFLVLQYSFDRWNEIMSTVRFEEVPQPQRSELQALGVLTEQRTRKLLDAGQLARYDRDSRPTGPQPAATGLQNR